MWSYSKLASFQSPPNFQAQWKKLLQISFVLSLFQKKKKGEENKAQHNKQGAWGC